MIEDEFYSLKELVRELESAQSEIVKLQEELSAKVLAYGTKMRDLFGIADGDKFNILQLIKAIKVVQKYED